MVNELKIAVVRDGKYLGISNGEKYLMIRDAFGTVVEAYKHLIFVFEDPGQTVEISPKDMLFLQKEFDASIDTPTKPMVMHSDELRNGDRNFVEADAEGNRT